MELTLTTNFRDFYDYSFSKTGTEFRRMDNEGMTRRAMLVFLDSLGRITPLHGLVRDVAPQLLAEYGKNMHIDVAANIIQVVVYTDEYAHRGEGKMLVSIREALATYPDHYCTEFIASNPSCLGESLRLLQVGKKSWWIKYRSYSDWRSNFGDGEEKVIGEERFGYNGKIRIPMWAIDFITVAGVPKYAVDFNVAPGLSALKDLLRPSEVYQLICEAVEHFQEVKDDSQIAVPYVAKELRSRERSG